ncbi:MAG: AraC family transcriptional regulator [Candidatus Rifleibacteriota bacterium]
MDYLDRVAEALQFIEDNIRSDMELTAVAESAGCSLFYFHRIFAALTGDTLKEYIRKRRMTLAANELVASRRRIIEIAVDYGFASQEAFTRSFKQHFGLTPARFRKNGLCYEIRAPRDLAQLQQNLHLRSGKMEPVIVEKPEFVVIGKQIATTPDGQNFKEIPMFWQRYMQEKTSQKIPNKVTPWKEYGICADGDENSRCFIYMIGAEVSSTAEIPAGMVARRIPASTYAVFTSKGPMPEAIQEVWKYIYGTWLPGQTRYIRTNTEDFELYDERCLKTVPEVDIYVPIKPR